MTAQTCTNYLRNGKENGVIRAGDRRSRKFWKHFHFNEWIFTLSLLAISVVIVTAKIYVHYGSGAEYSVKTSMYNIFNVQSPQQFANINKEKMTLVGERLINMSKEYSDTVASSFFQITSKYSWFLKATIGSIAFMAFTWFIIYKDSSIPGVNPPSPFSPTKKENSGNSRLQINYLIGVLNGIMIFVYMCL